MRRKEDQLLVMALLFMHLHLLSATSLAHLNKFSHSHPGAGGGGDGGHPVVSGGNGDPHSPQGGGGVTPLYAAAGGGNNHHPRHGGGNSLKGRAGGVVAMFAWFLLCKIQD